MNCDQVIDHLDKIVDGDLSSAERNAVDEHLAGCADCRSELHVLNEILRHASELPQSQEPTRDLWPEIHDRMRSTGGELVPMPVPATRKLGYLFAAAAVVVLTVATVILATRGGIDQPRSVDRGVGGEQSSTVVRTAYREVEVDMHHLREELRATLESRRSEISPATWDVITDNLKVIDEAITNIENALQNEPENPDLNRMLLAAYQSELDLLRRVARLPAEVVHS